MTGSSPRDSIKQAGFSLTETMISIVLISIASLALLEAVALSFEVLSRCRLLRRDSLIHWNTAQHWRAEVTASEDSQPALRRRILPETGAGTSRWELQHGGR